MDALIGAVFVLAVAGIVATVATVTVRRFLRHRGDREELAAWARQQGWQYRPAASGAVDRFCGEGEPFPGGGHHLRVRDLVSGEFRGRAFCAFTYGRRRPGIGDRRQASPLEFLRVVAVRRDSAGPRLQLSRAGVGNKLLDVIGAGGVTLDDALFDEAFRVTADDEAYAVQLLGPEVRQFLLRDERARDLPVRFARDEVVTWQDGHLTAPALEWCLGYLCDVLEHMAASPGERSADGEG